MTRPDVDATHDQTPSPTDSGDRTLDRQRDQADASGPATAADLPHLDATTAPTVPATGAWSGDAGPDDSPERVRLDPTAPLRCTVDPGRYTLHGEIARGGMGAVLKGRDTTLGRDLAVKVLLESHRSNPDLVLRFVEEAQIAGQLQHPGVVPVYDMGVFADRRPYFAMKLVKGRTLAEILNERPDPSRDWPRLLVAFLSVAQTMAYAHVRGVIHRDLKPSNVMVGSFGEVQVMDWGLAKVLPKSRVTGNAQVGGLDAHEMVITTARSGSDSDLSQAGSVMGTPSYMAPEQARGEVERLDERADVFALGSILCEILTGRPAFTGPSAGEIHRKAAQGDMADAFARLDTCGADAELIQLTQHCLKREPQDRLRDAGALTVELTGYRESVDRRLREAELAGAEARTKAVEERKRRRVTLALAAVVLAAVVLGGGGWLWVEQERQRRVASTTQRVQGALSEVAGHRAQARAQITDSLPWARAREAAKRAEALLQSGPLDPALAKHVRTLLDELADEEKDRRLAVGLEEASMAPTEPGRSSFSARECLPLFEAAFREYRVEIGKDDPKNVAARIRSRPGEIRDGIIAGLDHWIEVAGWFPDAQVNTNWIRAVVAGADPDPWRARLREAIRRKSRAELEALANDRDALAQWSITLTTLAHALEGVGSEDANTNLLRRAQLQKPGDFWLNSDLGQLLSRARPPQWLEAIRFLTAALSLRENSFTRTSLAYALRDSGRVDEALAVMRRAVELRPDLPFVHSTLAALLNQQGEVAAAIAEQRKAVELEPDDQGTNFNLCVMLLGTGDSDAARVASRQAVERFPAIHSFWLNSLGLSLLIGDEDGYRRSRHAMLTRFGTTTDALLAERTAKACLLLPASGEDLERACQLVDRALGVASPAWAIPYFELAKGMAEFRLGRPDGAVAWLERSRSHKADAWNLTIPAHFLLALAHHRLGHTNEAKTSLTTATRLFQGGPGLPGEFDGWICEILRREAETRVELEPRLEAIRRGEVTVRDAAERLALASLCARSRRHYRNAAHWFTEAFAADPTLADDIRAGSRYNAACCAVLAAAGRGAGAAQLDDRERAGLHRQALDWLRDDLAAWIKLLDAGASEDKSSGAITLHHWKADPDLASVRDPDALARLPREEQKAWHALWEGVNTLRKPVQGGRP